MARGRNDSLDGDGKDLLTAPQLAAAVLEIHYLPEDSPEHIAIRAADTFKMLEV